MMAPLAVLCYAWLAGIVAGPSLRPSPAGSLLVMAGAVPLAILIRPRPRLSLAFVALAVFLLAALRNAPTVEGVPENDVSKYNGAGLLAVVGVVEESPALRDALANVRVRVESVEIGDRAVPVKGSVLVRASRYSEGAIGDRVRVEGRLEEPQPFDGFDYPRYLAGRGIHSIMRFPSLARVGHDDRYLALTLIDDLRDRLARSLSSALPEPQAALSTGLLVGLRADLPPDLLDAFNRSGTSHLLAISGYNTSLVVVYLLTFATPLLGRRRGAVLALVGVVFFCVLTGAAPSAVRATIMAGLSMVAILAGRQNHAGLGLLLAAALMTVVQPQVIGDIGFQLSFAATAALISFGTGRNEFLTASVARLGAGKAGWIGGPLQPLTQATLVTVLASMATLPLVAYHFGTAPLAGLVANLLVDVVVGPILGLSALVAVFGAVWPGLASVVSGLDWVPLSYMIAVVRWSAALPLAAVTVPPMPGWVLWLFLGAGGLVWWVSADRSRLAHLRVAWFWVRAGAGSTHVSGRVVLGLVTGVVVVWTAVLAQPDGRLHVFFLDVGQGDAIFIRGPAGKVLIDGGPSPQRLLSQLGRTMPFWDRRIDYLVLTHAHADHLTGLVEVLERFEVRGVVEGSSKGNDAAYQKWEELVGQNGQQRIAAEPGLRLRLGDQSDLTVISAPSSSGTPGSASNEESLALRLSAPAVSVLLLGDLETDGQNYLLASGAVAASTILKVPHHGSQNSLSQELLRVTAPRLAVISVGADNRFGHPAPSTLEQLAKVQTLRTDQRGTIELVTDGQVYWVRSER
ncbi:MAG: ComEC/Rec2 family competence protein [Chloroflexota bacterium]|nr:MAG: ComEC/Rec2 family competence protein [Chloroflexota bacterium]